MAHIFLAAVILASVVQERQLLVRLSCELEQDAKSSLVVRVALENAGEESLEIYRRLLWGHRGGLVLRILDQEGRTVHPVGLADDSVPAGDLGREDVFLSLRPGEFLGTTRRESLEFLGIERGFFSIFVDYRSPVGSRFNGSPSYWRRELGTVSSSACYVQVP